MLIFKSWEVSVEEPNVEVVINHLNQKNWEEKPVANSPHFHHVKIAIDL